MPIRPSITPCLVYADAPAAIDFLCTAFGFTRHLVVPGGTERDIVHAQLTLDGNMIMLSSASPGYARALRHGYARADTGGLVTGCVCVALADPDAHYARAAAAGADITGVRCMIMSMAGGGMRRGIARGMFGALGLMILMRK